MSGEKPQKTGYHELPANQYGGDKTQWKQVPAVFSGEGETAELRIDGHPVMEAWEQPYMAALAKIATKRGGRILEVGFGLGLSATAVQQNDVEEHVIIEANADVISRGREWATKQPHKVTFLHGLWHEVLPSVADESIDGILYDTYPLTKEEQHTHQFDFIRQAFPKLKAGGVLTYCNLTSLGVLKGQYEDWQKLWEETQVPHIKEIGFSSFSFETFGVSPPAGCQYYSGHSEALVPVLHK